VAFLTQTLLAQTVSVAAAGTSVAPSTLPAENTHTLIVRNESTASIFFGFVAAGGALVKNDSVVVPAGASAVRGIGARSARAGGADVELAMAFDTDPISAPAVIRLEYLNGRSN